VLVKSLQNTPGNQPFGSDTRAFVNSISIDRHRNRAVLTATVPTALVQRLINAPQELRATPLPGAQSAP
jgi:hypothetical protein